MEIDFLGLNSSKYKSDHQNPKNPYVDSGGGVEVSLSLSTSSSLNSSEKISSPNRLASYTKEKTQQPSLLLVAPPLLRHTAGGGFLYDLNDAATLNLRNINMAKLCTEPPATLTMVYPIRPNVFTQPGKAENSVYLPANAPTGGYTPTVAMARRATLARFLEKRLHRMKNQSRACHLMGRSLKSATNLEVVETITKNNNKKKTILKEDDDDADAKSDYW